MGLAALELQVLGELHAPLARADDEHGTVGQRRRVAIAGRVDRRDVRRQPLGAAREGRDVVATDGEHDLVGGGGPGVRLDREAAVV